MLPQGQLRRWRVASADRSSAVTLAEALGCSPLLAALLLKRGCATPEAALAFLDAPLGALEDPNRMAGMPQAVARLRRAVAHHEPILVCGDFDVDGVSGTAILVDGLRRAGAEVAYRLPQRLKHGYGLPAEIVEEAAALGARLLLAVDHGVSAHAACSLAGLRGLDVVICDHHLPGPALPPAIAVLNPKRDDCTYPFRELCGAAIAFKLLEAFFGPEGREEVLHLLELVALATVADLVPLLGENRILVKHGLSRMAATRRPGLRALADVADVPLGNALDPWHVAFCLAPRINAAGRLGDATVAVRLLLTDDAVEAKDLAAELDRQNGERQALEGAILEEALRQVETRHDLTRDRALALFSANWHPGVLGIVASRLADRFGRPTALIGMQQDEARGSARATAGWHVTEALRQCDDLLLRYGGHRAAAGFSLVPDRVDAFRDRFLALAARDLTADALVPVLDADAEVSLDDLDLPVADSLARLAPFGAGNREPLLVARDVQVMQFPRVVGKNHLKLRVRQSVRGRVIEAIAFNLGGWAAILAQPAAPKMDLAFVAERNEWNGRAGLQLRVKDLRIGGRSTPPDTSTDPAVG